MKSNQYEDVKYIELPVECEHMGFILTNDKILYVNTNYKGGKGYTGDGESD
jgi:hypothetical protein